MTAKQDVKSQLYGIVPIQYVNNYFIYENSVYKRSKSFDPTKSYHFDVLLNSNEYYDYMTEKISKKKNHLFIFMTLDSDYKEQLNNMAEFMLYFYDKLAQSIECDQKLAFSGCAYTESQKVLDLFSPVDNLLELQNQRPFKFNLVSIENLKAKLNACQVRLNLKKDKQKYHLLYKFTIVNMDQQIAYEYAFTLSLVNQQNCLYLNYLIQNQFLQNIGKKYYNDLIPFIKSFDIILYVMDIKFNYAIYLNNLKTIKIDPQHQKKLLLLIQEYYSHKEQLERLNKQELDETNNIIMEATKKEADEETNMIKSEEQLASSTNQATHQLICDEYSRSQIAKEQQKSYNKNIDILKQNIDKIMQQSKYLSQQSKMEILQAQQNVINRQMLNDTDPIEKQFIQSVGKFKAKHKQQTFEYELDGLDQSKLNESQASQIQQAESSVNQIEDNQEAEQVQAPKPEYLVFDAISQKPGKSLFKEIIVSQYISRYMNRLDYTRLLRLESFRLSNAEMEFVTQNEWTRISKLVYQAKNDGVISQSIDLSANQKFQPLLRFLSALKLQWQLQNQLVLLLNQKAQQLFVLHCADFGTFLEQFYTIWQENQQKAQENTKTIGKSQHFQHNVINQKNQTSISQLKQQRGPQQSQIQSLRAGQQRQQQISQHLSQQGTQEKTVLLWGNKVGPGVTKNSQVSQTTTLAERLKQQKQLKTNIVKY